MHLIAISACPPYNEFIPVESCRTTVENLSKAMAGAFDVAPENTLLLTDEDAAGANVLKALSNHAERIGPQDTVVFYVNGHGATYSDWTEAWISEPEMRNMISGLHPSNKYMLQFWTQARGTVPGLAVANDTLMPVTRLLDAFGDIPGKMALIVDSCSSGLVLSNPHLLARNYPFLDHISVSSGPYQGSNLTLDLSSSLFSDALSEALQKADDNTFAEIIQVAKEDTSRRVVGICAEIKITRNIFLDLFPEESLEHADLFKPEVNLPDWYCHQTPQSHSFGGTLAERVASSNSTG